MEYFKTQCKKNDIIISNQEYDLFESKKFRKPHHSDQHKWQVFYNRLANTDPKHLGIEIQHLLNNIIMNLILKKC